MVNQTDSKPVTLAQCNQRHQTTTRMLGLMIAIMICGVSAIGWSITTGQEQAAKSVVERYIAGREGARQSEQLKGLQRSVDLLRAEMHKQRTMIEDLWSQNKRGNP